MPSFENAGITTDPINTSDVSINKLNNKLFM